MHRPRGYDSQGRPEIILSDASAAARQRRVLGHCGAPGSGVVLTQVVEPLPLLRAV